MNSMAVKVYLSGVIFRFPYLIDSIDQNHSVKRAPKSPLRTRTSHYVTTLLGSFWNGGNMTL